MKVIQKCLKHFAGGLFATMTWVAPVVFLALFHRVSTPTTTNGNFTCGLAAGLFAIVGAPIAWGISSISGIIAWKIYGLFAVRFSKFCIVSSFLAFPIVTLGVAAIAYR